MLRFPGRHTPPHLTILQRPLQMEGAEGTRQQERSCSESHPKTSAQEGKSRHLNTDPFKRQILTLARICNVAKKAPVRVRTHTHTHGLERRPAHCGPMGHIQLHQCILIPAPANEVSLEHSPSHHSHVVHGCLHLQGRSRALSCKRGRTACGA